MIDQISGIPMVEEESLYAEKPKDALGRDEFLKLFLAQMNHQDPLNPMDSQQFSAQLAQFSSLEQLFNVNENLENLGASQAESIQYQALNLIGKEVLAQGDTLNLADGETATAGFALAGKAECTVYVTDAVGFPIRELNLGVLEPGQHLFDWDGRSQAGELQNPGAYRFEVVAVGPGGQLTSTETLIKGEVDRVNLAGSEPILFMGDLPLSLSQIVDIRVNEESGATT